MAGSKSQKLGEFGHETQICKSAKGGKKSKQKQKVEGRSY